MHLIHCKTQLYFFNLHAESLPTESRSFTYAYSNGALLNLQFVSKRPKNSYKKLYLLTFDGKQPFTQGKFLGISGAQRNGAPSSHIHGGFYHEFNEWTSL